MGLRGFERRDHSAMLAIALDAAASTDPGEVIVGATTRRLREDADHAGGVFHVGAVALVARAQARRQASSSLACDLTPEQVQGLENLLPLALASGRTGLAWTRE